MYLHPNQVQILNLSYPTKITIKNNQWLFKPTQEQDCGTTNRETQKLPSVYLHIKIFLPRGKYELSARVHGPFSIVEVRETALY